MDILVPPIALGIGVFAGFLVYRHAIHHQVQSPLLWGGFVGVNFFLAPIILTPFLIPVYYSLFIPPVPGHLVRPLHALATVLGGETLAAMGAVLVYIGQLALARRQRTGSP